MARGLLEAPCWEPLFQSIPLTASWRREQGREASVQTCPLSLIPLTLAVRQGENDVHMLYRWSLPVIWAEINNTSVTVSSLKGKEEKYSRSKMSLGGLCYCVRLNCIQIPCYMIWTHKEYILMGIYFLVWEFTFSPSLGSGWGLGSRIQSLTENKILLCIQETLWYSWFKKFYFSLFLRDFFRQPNGNHI